VISGVNGAITKFTAGGFNWSSNGVTAIIQIATMDCPYSDNPNDATIWSAATQTINLAAAGPRCATIIPIPPIVVTDTTIIAIFATTSGGNFSLSVSLVIS
jgi:hypothetical protein